MTQVQFGSVAFGEFESVPDLVPKFTGLVGERSQMPSNVHYKEVTRRHDGLIPHFGVGTPTMHSSLVDVHGIADALAPVAYQPASTSEGTVQLPIETTQLRYIPSTERIDFLTHAQYSRLQPTPPRFFR